MATIIGAFNQVVHEASTAFIDNQMTTKMSDAVTSVVKSSFEVVEDVLKIMKDLTEAEEGGDT